MVIEALWTVENGYLLGLWLVAGFLLTWNRKIGVAIAVPAVVAALPMLFGIGPEGTLVLLPYGMSVLPFITGIAFPVIASVLGGHVAIAINPQGRTSRQTRTVLDQVKRHAERVEAEIMRIESEIRATRGEATLRPIAGASIDDGRPAVDDEWQRLNLLRMQVASRRQELRELSREAS